MEVVLKKGCITYFHTKKPFPVLSCSECLMCKCELCLFTLILLFLCISRQELSLIKSNQKIYDFYK